MFEEGREVRVFTDEERYTGGPCNFSISGLHDWRPDGNGGFYCANDGCPAGK